MEVKVTIGATPELTGLALAVTNLINGQANFNFSGAIKSLIPVMGVPEEDENIAKEEKPKANRNRTKKEEPTVQEPPKKEEVEIPKEEEKPAEEKVVKSKITIEDIRKIQRKVSLGGGIEKMKDLLATFGVESASELKESDYDAYYEKLEGLV